MHLSFKVIVQWILCVLTLVIANACTSLQPAEESSLGLTPTEAANLVWQELYSQPDISQQKEIVESIFGRVPEQYREKEDRLTQLALGEEAFLSFQPAAALKLYAPLANGDGLIAQHAADRVMQINFRAFEKRQLASEMMSKFRAKFQASELNTRWLFQQTGNFMEFHFAKGEQDKAIDYLLVEIESLPNDAPYYSYGLVIQYAEEIERSGRGDEVRRVVENGVFHLKETQQAWEMEGTVIPDLLDAREQMPDWYWWMQRIPVDESIRSARLRQMNGLLPALEAWLE